MLERYLHQQRVTHAETFRVAIDLVPERPPKRTPISDDGPRNSGTFASVRGPVG